MVIAESVATSTMILNHLLMPLVLRLKIKKSFSTLLLALKRMSIFLVVFLGYAYYKIIGDTFMLVNIGLISFSAAAQLAPSVIGAMYWKRGNTAGAIAGIIGGFVDLVLHADAAVLHQVRMDRYRPAGKGAFRHIAAETDRTVRTDRTRHVEQHPFLEHVFQIGGYLLFSILFEQNEMEREQCLKFVEPFADGPPKDQVETKRLSKQVTVMEFVNLMENFIGKKAAHMSNKQLSHRTRNR